MVYVLDQTLSNGITVEVVDDIVDEIGLNANPADGMISHVHYEEDGQTRIIDLWESEEHLKRFSDERLTPAREKVLARRGIDPDTVNIVKNSVTQAHCVVPAR